MLYLARLNIDEIIGFSLHGMKRTKMEHEIKLYWYDILGVIL